MRLNNLKEEWQMFLRELIQIDPDAQLFCLTDSQIKHVSKNWEEIVHELWPDSSDHLIHSIRELCDIGDTDKKAATCFRVCQRDWKSGKIDLKTIRRKLYPILRRAITCQNAQSTPIWKTSDRDCKQQFLCKSLSTKVDSNDKYVGVKKQVSTTRPVLLRYQSQDISDKRQSKRKKSSHKGLALHRIFNKGGVKKKAANHNNNKKCFKRRLLSSDLRLASRDSGYESDTCIIISKPPRNHSQSEKSHKPENFTRKYTNIISEEQRNKYKMKYKKHHTRYLKLHHIFENTSEKLKMVEPGSEEWRRIVGEYEKAKEFNKSKSASTQFSIHDQLQYLTKKLIHIRTLINVYDYKRYNVVGQDYLVEKETSELSNLYKKFHDVLSDHYSLILAALLPSHALPLTDALETIYPQDKENKAFETLLLLKRYSKMFYTNMDSVQLILKSLSENQEVHPKEIRNGIPSEFQDNHCFVYDVVLSQQLPANDEEKVKLKEGILRSLTQIGTDPRLRQWLYQLHKQKTDVYGWESLSNSLVEEDFHRVSIRIPDIFYGGVTHVPVLVKFSYPSDTSNDETILDRIDKLNQLYRIALENLDSILHKDREIRIENGILYLQPKSNEEREDTVIIKQIREIWGRAKHDPLYRDLLVTKLQENNIPFYATEDILDILSRDGDEDIDTLEVGVWKIDLRGQKTTLIAGTYIWPKLTRRLSELDNTFLPELHKRFVSKIPSCFNKSIGKCLILNLAIYQDQQLLQEAWSFLERNDSILLNLLVHFRSNNGTIKGLLNGLNECKHKDCDLDENQNQEKRSIVIDLIADIKIFIEEKHRDWMDQFNLKIPPKITSRNIFLKFLETHELSQFPKMNPEEFKEKLRTDEILDGDQVWFWRKRGFATVCYAHVGIFVKHLNNTGLNGYSLSSGYIIHVQPRKYRKFQAKIVYEPVESAVHNGDELFVVQAEDVEGGLSRSQIRSRAIKCCYPKLTFCYDSYFGSCETFASKICGTNNLSQLNTQGLKVALEPEGRTKSFFADRLHDVQSSGDLLEKLEKRLVESPNEDVEDSFSSIDRSDSSFTTYDLSDEMDIDDGTPRPLDMPIFPDETTETIRPSEKMRQEDSQNDEYSSLRSFLSRLKLSELEDLFINEGVTMERLPLLNDENLKHDIGVKKFGHRLVILKECQGHYEPATPFSDLGNSIRSVSDSGCSVRSVDSENFNPQGHGNLLDYRPGPSVTPHL